ncbi:MAG: hypothetical protein ACTSYE_00600 [Alphaproteobacteria bacterium]
MTAKGALSFLEPIETQARGVAILDALAEMIDRAEIEIGELILSELWDGLVLGRAATRAGRPLSEQESASALEAAPIPQRLNFTLSYE